MVESDLELRVAYPAWRSVMHILGHPERLATGLLHRSANHEMLADALRVTDQTPTGADWPPLLDWIAIAAPRPADPVTPEHWLGRLQPRFAQRLVVVLIGLPPERQGWRGWVCERGAITPLTGFTIVGSGMVRVGDETMNEVPSERWSRTIDAVSPTVFSKLQTSRVAVIGASRSGSIAAATLATLPIRQLVLVDADQVESHNLDCGLWFTEADIGANKAIALGKHLVEHRSDLLVQVLPLRLEDHRVRRQLPALDLIVTCVDSDAGRLTAARLARARLMVHLDVGTSVALTPAGQRQLTADVRLLCPTDGCVGCVGGLTNRAEAEYLTRDMPGLLPRSPPEAWNARGRLGSLVTLNEMAVAIGIQHWLDLLSGDLAGSVWTRLRWSADQALECESARVGANSECRICRERGL